MTRSFRSFPIYLPLIAGLAILASAWVCPHPAAAGTAFGYERDEVEARRFERDFLIAHPSIAYRVDKELHLRLDGGRELVLQDVGAVGTECDYAESTCYSLIGYSPIYRHFLVFQGFYESWEYLLIDRRTGRATYVHDVPHLSPDHKRIATAIGNLSDEFNNGVFVWSIDAQRLREDWAHAAPETVGYAFERWLDADRFALTVELPSTSPRFASMICRDTREAVAEHGADGWRIIHGRLVSMTCYPQ